MDCRRVAMEWFGMSLGHCPNGFYWFGTGLIFQVNESYRTQMVLLCPFDLCYFLAHTTCPFFSIKFSSEF